MDPGTLTAPDRVSLGENSLMAIGGNAADPNSAILIRFVQGVADASAGEIDVTDNMSQGFTDVTRTPRTCRVTADCFWRADDNPISNPPFFDEGDLTDRVLVWPDYQNAPDDVFKFPEGFCVNFTVTIAGTAEVRFSIVLRNSGPYYTPSRPDPAGPFG